jgi:transposase
MQKEAFLGIDVSKGYADFMVFDNLKNQLDADFELYDTPQDRKQLKSIITKWFENGLCSLKCGVESTGGYENNWYNFLRNLSKDFNIQVARLNARGVKAVSDASLKRTITDGVSAENIAVYLMSFPEKVNYAVDRSALDLFKEGKQHYSYIRMLQKQKVQLVNQLEKLLYQYFDQMLGYCRHGMPSWLLRMLIKYPCAEAVLKAGHQRLTAVKGISEGKAKALLTKASLNDQIAGKQIQHVIQQTSKQILQREELLADEKEYLTDQLRDHEDVKLLNLVPGIGLQSAVVLLLQIETVARFETSKKLVSNFGVHPTFKQSGDGIWGKHMSKKGPGELRAVLYMSALTAVRCSPLFKGLYAKFRAKGMNHYQAIGVVMHKMLRIIYGILKTKTPFNEEVDKKNIEQSEQKQKQNKEANKELEKQKQDTKHRYIQTKTDEAPVSRKHAQTKKKQIASQSS